MIRKKENSLSGFKQAKESAVKVLSQPERVNQLVSTSKKKLSELELKENDFKGILGTISTFIRMLKAFRSGRYNIPWSTILLVAGALIYFVVPLDMLPDFIPITGYVDDFAVVMAIFNKVKEEVVSFQAWENSSPI